MSNKLFDSLKGRLIISCQALPEEPLHSSFIMSRMALAAKMAGAVGIRCNTIPDIQEIKKTVDLPLIGIIKRVYPDQKHVYITPTEVEVEALIAEGVDIIAIDATNRLHPGGKTLEQFFAPIRSKYREQLFMADCSSVEECFAAQELGFDCVGTTLFGATEETKGQKLPPIEAISMLSKELSVPLIAEGGIHYPHQLKEALDAGAWCAVVGGAITRPLEIATRFIQAIS